MRPAKAVRNVRDSARVLLGRPVKPGALLSRRTLAQAYLRGTGIEIGALHYPLPVPVGVTVRYVDWKDVPGLHEHFPEMQGKRLVQVDIVDDGETLATVGDATQDFLIANHFVEHCEDPIGALRNFLRVLKPGGILFLTIPDKRFTFDRERPVTTLDHLHADARDGGEGSRRSHYEEHARALDHLTDEAQVAARVDELMRDRLRTHFHVWTQTEILELVVWLQRQMPLDLEVFFKHGIEVLLVLRKPAPVPAT
jgi:SAM-dependent methyltransferase